MSRRACRLARQFPNELPHALREAGLLAALSGDARRAKRLLNEYVAALNALGPDSVQAHARVQAALEEMQRASSAVVVATAQALREAES